MNDFDNMTREELVQYLESWGYQCYDHETLDELRFAAKLNAHVEGEDEVE